jgi:hypothetical protein
VEVAGGWVVVRSHADVCTVMHTSASAEIFVTFRIRILSVAERGRGSEGNRVASLFHDVRGELSFECCKRVPPRARIVSTITSFSGMRCFALQYARPRRYCRAQLFPTVV